MKITHHAEKQFKKRYFEMWSKAHNPMGLIKSVLKAGVKTRYKNQPAIRNGSLIAPYVIDVKGEQVIKTIIREFKDD